MKTQDELRREYDRLLEAGDYESAGRVLDLIEPISDEEWLKILHDAPLDDEPVSAELLGRFEQLEAALAASRHRRAL